MPLDSSVYEDYLTGIYVSEGICEMKANTTAFRLPIS